MLRTGTFLGRVRRAAFAAFLAFALGMAAPCPGAAGGHNSGFLSIAGGFHEPDSQEMPEPQRLDAEQRFVNNLAATYTSERPDYGDARLGILPLEIALAEYTSDPQKKSLRPADLHEQIKQLGKVFDSWRDEFSSLEDELWRYHERARRGGGPGGADPGLGYRVTKLADVYNQRMRTIYQDLVRASDELDEDLVRLRAESLAPLQQAPRENEEILTEVAEYVRKLEQADKPSKEPDYAALLGRLEDQAARLDAVPVHLQKTKLAVAKRDLEAARRDLVLLKKDAEEAAAQQGLTDLLQDTVRKFTPVDDTARAVWEAADKVPETMRRALGGAKEANEELADLVKQLQRMPKGGKKDILVKVAEECKECGKPAQYEKVGTKETKPPAGLRPLVQRAEDEVARAKVWAMLATKRVEKLSHEVGPLQTGGFPDIAKFKPDIPPKALNPRLASPKSSGPVAKTDIIPFLRKNRDDKSREKIVDGLFEGR
jgi:hypothetical protein